MTFSEDKAQAKKDGMIVNNRTKKTDIASFYASMEKTEDLGEFKAVTVISDKCPICDTKLYHGLCSKHGRVI